MACSPEFIQYITEQLKNAGRITCRKMFGEYRMFQNGWLNWYSVHGKNFPFHVRRRQGKTIEESL